MTDMHGKNVINKFLQKKVCKSIVSCLAVHRSDGFQFTKVKGTLKNLD